MKNTVVMIRTPGGKQFARKIGHDLNKLNMSYYMSSTEYFPAVFNKHPELNSNNTIIHARAAHPNFSAQWLLSLRHYQDLLNYRVYNDVSTLMLTSDKLRTYQTLMKNGYELPWTEAVGKDSKEAIYNLWVMLHEHGVYVIKPYQSNGQGKYVQKFVRRETEDNRNQFYRTVLGTPFNPVVVQEFVNYTAIHRVITLLGQAVSYTFVDKAKDGDNWKEADWKVSVCLNKISMEYNANPDLELLDYAERIQKDIGGHINFIDVFETKDGYVLSEINTACNLSIHERISNQDISMSIAETLRELFGGGYD